MALIAPLEPARLHRLAEQALREQPGAGHATHVALIPPNRTCSAQLLVHQTGVLCGLDAAAAVFETIDPTLRFEPLAWDSAPLSELPAAVAQISGHAASLLAAQAVALALIGRLSGIATHTLHHVEAVNDTRAQILDTNTAPGTLESYAIGCGGGHTELPRQASPILITTTHIQLAGGISAAIDRARKQLPPGLTIEIETHTLEEAKQALAAHADALLLSNMQPETISQVVDHAPAHIWLHATGHITLSNIESFALPGIHAITPHELTRTAPTLDTTLTLT